MTRHTITFIVPLTLTSVTIGCFASKGLVTDDRLARIGIQPNYIVFYTFHAQQTCTVLNKNASASKERAEVEWSETAR